MTTDSPQIAAIKVRYQQSFEDKAEVVSDHLNALLGGESITLSLTDTREMLHKLAGSSGMYGYDDISTICRTAMKRVDQSQTSVLINELEQLKDLLEQYA